VAAAAECAHSQGRFWGFHDLIFERGGIYNIGHLERDAERLGLDMARFRACLQSGEGMEAVKRDIAEAVKIGVPSTPTYVINGVPMVGMLNPATFEEMAAVLREARR
jgi:protein-disulfide isomerase